METKTQVEDSIIQESLLTCIDLANSDHQSVLSLKQQSKNFFALPLVEKMKVLKNEKHRGYTPFYDQIPDPENQVQGTCNQLVPFPAFILSIFLVYKIYTPSKILKIHLYVLPGWRETMEKYHQEALRVCKAIAKLLALALDMDADYFDSPEMLGKPISTLRLLHYEGKSDPSKGIYGTGAHSDYGMMTLIATDGVLGLQICKDRNAKPQKWEYVPSIEGALVVNLGDMMQCWSNGLFRSTMHRVILNDQNRYSIPFFLEPNHDCIIECLPTCQSESNLPKYPAIKCSTYLTQRYEEVHANFRSYEKHA
nr:unnamed protein product [Brassica rapa]